MGFPFIRVSCKYISTPTDGPGHRTKAVTNSDPNLSRMILCFLRCRPRVKSAHLCVPLYIPRVVPVKLFKSAMRTMNRFATRACKILFTSHVGRRYDDLARNSRVFHQRTIRKSVTLAGRKNKKRRTCLIYRTNMKQTACDFFFSSSSSLAARYRFPIRASSSRCDQSHRVSSHRKGRFSS